MVALQKPPFHSPPASYILSDARELIVRRASLDDMSKLMELYAQAWAVGTLDQQQCGSIYRLWCELGKLVFVGEVVHEGEAKIVGTASALYEPKIIHAGGGVLHVEDVITHVYFRRLGIAGYLKEHFAAIAKQLGCYKMILVCKEENVPVYEAMGMRRTGEVEMRQDLE